MRPTPIPDAEIGAGDTRMVIGPPRGNDLTGQIRPVEALVRVEAGVPIYSMRFILEPGDLERLDTGEPFWLTMWGAVVPFDIAMTEPT